MRENTKPGDSVVAQTFRSVSPQEDRTRMCGRFKTWCVRDGETIWVEEGKNLITDMGDNHFLNVALHTLAKVTTWYLGLINASPTILQTNTMVLGSRSWTEVQNYSDANRPAWSPTGASTAGSIVNTPAAFTIITSSVTVGGVFLVDNNVKGSTGASEVLLAAIAFSADKPLDPDDILNVEYTFTADNQP